MNWRKANPNFVVSGMNLRPEFFKQKARLYRAWTGLSWRFCVTVPDARWACGHESQDAATFAGALWLLRWMMAVRRSPRHPWCQARYADPNWLVAS